MRTTLTAYSEKSKLMRTECPILPKVQGQPLSHLPQGLPVMCFGSGSDKPPSNILSFANS